MWKVKKEVAGIWYKKYDAHRAERDALKKIEGK